MVAATPERVFAPAVEPPLRPAHLGALPAGVTARVVAVELPGSLGDRLVELGFTPGAPVLVLRQAPFGGPLLVRIREYVLSLRRAQAEAVRVRES